MFTESAGTVFTKITEPAALALRETETWVEQAAENCESSFLLDWLAGADASLRSIPRSTQGFSFKFEDLGVVSPR